MNKVTHEKICSCQKLECQKRQNMSKTRMLARS